MAELSAGAEPAPEQLALGDDRSPDPGADGEHGHRVDLLPGTEPELRPSSGVGVVVDGDLEFEVLEQPLAQGLVSPRDVRRVVDSRLGLVDEAGGGDARRGDRMQPGQAPDHRDHGIHDPRRVDGIGRDPVLCEDRAVLVDDRARDLGPADVDPDRMHGGSVGRLD